MYEATLIPILLAGLAAMVIGFVWYHPKVFGSAWMRMLSITPEMAEAGKKKMPLMAFLGVLANIVVAYTMNQLGVFLNIYDITGATLSLALPIWYGFMAPILLGAVLWEGRPFRFFLINGGYWLVALMVMSIILVTFSGVGGDGTY